MSVARIFALTLALTFVTVIGVSSFAPAAHAAPTGTPAEAPKTSAAPTDDVPLSSSYKPYLIYPVLRYDPWYDRGSGQPGAFGFFEDHVFGRKATPDK